MFPLHANGRTYLGIFILHKSLLPPGFLWPSKCSYLKERCQKKLSCTILEPGSMRVSMLGYNIQGNVTENTLLLVSYYYNFKSLILTDDFYHLKQISALKAILESKRKAF